jgi:hypothetical protein
LRLFNNPKTAVRSAIGVPSGFSALTITASLLTAGFAAAGFNVA